MSVIGVYGGLMDKFPMGALMNKGLTIKTGQCHVQRYLKPLYERVKNGDIDPSFVVTHRLSSARRRRLRDVQAQAGRVREGGAQALRRAPSPGWPRRRGPPPQGGRPPQAGRGPPPGPRGSWASRARARRGRSAWRAPIHAGYSTLTDYPLGVVKLIPYKAHLALDALGAVALAATPFVTGQFRKARSQWLPHVGLCLFELGCWR